jgi:hypothetical protein
MHGRTVTPSNFIHGMSEYAVGDRLVLFLIPNYMRGTVTYPVGLYQGAFFVSRMPSGRDLVRNGINNLGLFTSPYNGTAMKAGAARVIFPDRDEAIASTLGPGARDLAYKRGALPLDAFLLLTEEIVTARGDVKGEVLP